MNIAKLLAEEQKNQYEKCMLAADTLGKNMKSAEFSQNKNKRIVT